MSVNKRVFVTGGSGFVGRNLISRLVAERRPDEIRALARSESSKSAVLKAGATSVIEGDLNSLDALTRGMEGCDVVYHIAATVGSGGKTEDFVKGNVEGTKNVVEACKRAKVPVLVHCSTEAVLVEALGKPLINVDESCPIPSKHAGIYGQTKAEAERIVNAANSPELKTVIARPRFIWGKDDTTLLAAFKVAAQTGQLKWFGGGNNLISHVHVENCVHGLILCAENGAAGQTYFLTDGEPHSFRELVSRMLKAVGVEPPPESATLPLWLASMVATGAEWWSWMVGGQPLLTNGVLALIAQEVTVNDTKARKELGYSNVVSVDEGMKDLEERHQQGLI